MGLKKAKVRHVPDIDREPEFNALYSHCQPFSMTSKERLFGLFKSVEYIVKRDLPGDFVECGVWRGGSVMMMALALQHFGVTDRRIWLYDTFAGMTTPGDEDRNADGTAAEQLAAGDEDSVVRAFASRQDVEQNIHSTGYAPDCFKLVEGDILQTIPETAPEEIALLRLDTDWYESSRHELLHLYPRLGTGGVLIIDDYGDWDGARQAVDEYFADAPVFPLLCRIDGTGRIVVKV